MARYNEKRLSYAEQDRLVKMFSRVLERLRRRDPIYRFLKDLLNRQERLMLARRLLIAEMLVDGKTYRNIQLLLGAAPNTIARVERWLNFGRKGILSAVIAKKYLK